MKILTLMILFISSLTYGQSNQDYLDVLKSMQKDNPNYLSSMQEGFEKLDKNIFNDYILSSPYHNSERVIDILMSGDESKYSTEFFTDLRSNSVDQANYLKALSEKLRENPNNHKALTESIDKFKQQLKIRNVSLPTPYRCAFAIPLYISMRDYIYSSRNFMWSDRGKDSTLPVKETTYAMLLLTAMLCHTDYQDLRYIKIPKYL